LANHNEPNRGLAAVLSVTIAYQCEWQIMAVSATVSITRPRQIHERLTTAIDDPVAWASVGMSVYYAASLCNTAERTEVLSRVQTPGIMVYWSSHIFFFFNRKHCDKTDVVAWFDHGICGHRKVSYTAPCGFRGLEQTHSVSWPNVVKGDQTRHPSTSVASSDY